MNANQIAGAGVAVDRMIQRLENVRNDLRRFDGRVDKLDNATVQNLREAFETALSDRGLMLLKMLVESDALAEPAADQPTGQPVGGEPGVDDAVATAGQPS